MKTINTNTNKQFLQKTTIALFVMLLTFLGQVNAQVSLYSFAQSSTTYTPITGGVLLSSGSTMDDANFAALPIGFTFNYNGTNYTSFSVNENGYIRFATTIGNSYSVISATGATTMNTVAGANRDMGGVSASSSLRYETIGTAPNRTLVVQWTSISTYFGSDNWNFQIRLNEGTNTIQLVYGPFTTTTTASFQIGLKGAANTDYNNRTTTANWSSTTSGTANTNTVAVSPTINPTSGLTFTYSPPPPCAGTPNGGTTVLTAVPGCGTGNFTLGVNVTMTTGITYQWQSSSDSLVWTDIVSATAATYSGAPVSTATYYRRNTTCTASTLTGSSNAFLVNPVYAGTAQATAPVCGDSLTLSLINMSASTTSAQWESSTDSLIWSPIAGAIANSQKVISPIVPTFYRAQVGCSTSSSTDYSVPVKVSPVRGGSASLSSSFCNDSTTLNLTNASSGTVLYDWLSSTDSITWTSMGITTGTAKFPSPTAVRFYRSVVTCGLTSDTSLVVKVTEPCQGFGPYSVTRNTAATYTSIQATGNQFTWVGGSGDDDYTQKVAIPFPFTYNGAVQTAFIVSTNGWLSFDSTAATSNLGNDLNSTSPRRVIAPLWEDLVVLGNNAANRSYIKYLVTGTTPNRVMTVEWAEMERYNYGSPNLNFQVKLYENNSNVEIVYGRMQPFDGAGAGTFSYTMGLSGNNPAIGQKIAQSLENTANFSTTTSNNNLSYLPACNSSYLFTNGAAFNPTSVSSIPTNDSSTTPTVLVVNPIPCADGCGTYYTSRGATASSVVTGPSATGGTPDDDVWFQFSAPASGQVNISIIGSPGYNPAFQVMTATFDTTGIGPAGSQNSSSTDVEQATVVGLTASTNYLVRVFSAGVGAGSASGAFSICINEVVPVPVNDDTTGSIALAVTQTYTPVSGTSLGATASAQTVCTGTADDDVWFRFIPNNYVDTVSVTGTGFYRAAVQVLTTGMVSVACQSTSTNAGTVKFALTNLKKDSTYYIRVYHANAGASSGVFNIGVYGNPGVDNDLSGVTVTRPTQNNCYPVADSVFATIRNASFSNTAFDFSTNNAVVKVLVTPPTGTPVLLTSDPLVAGTVAPNADTNVFVGVYTFTAGGTYSFKSIAASVIDTNRVNDTSAAVNRVNNLFSIPYVNNVETAPEVSQYALNGFYTSLGTGVGASQNFRVNLYSFNPTASITSPRFAVTSAGVFAFKYRVINWSGGAATVLSLTDSIAIEASVDCGVTFSVIDVINGSNHTPSTNYADKMATIGTFSPNEVIVRIRGNWNGTSNDAYIDIDSFYLYNTLPPTVTTGTKSNVSNLTATLAGNIINNGGGAVSASGVVIATTANPVLGAPGTIDAPTSPIATLGAFTANASGLTATTLYHYRAYAVNGAGTSYGADSTFTTLSAPIAPGVSKIAPDSITVSGAKVGGDISTNGGSAVIASGIVYGTSPNPALGVGSAIDAPTTPTVLNGPYSLTLTGLTQGTKYYYRAYATNSVGTGYSVQDSFTTSPVVSTLPYNQNFDIAGNTGWGATSVTGTINDWVLGTPAKASLNGAFSGTKAYVTKVTGTYTPSQNSALVSPQFDFTTYAADPILRFRSNYDIEQDYDLGVVEISINNGPWVRLDSTLGNGSNYNTANSASWYNNAATSLTPPGPAFSGSSAAYATAATGGWVKSATRLTGAAGQANVKFRFHFVADGFVDQEGWAIDDIEVVDVTTPTVPASTVALASSTSTTATLTWTNGNGQGRMVVARLSSGVQYTPVDNTNYNASSVFGAADSTGLGNYIVYKGNGSTTTVTGLTMLTNYVFDVYEYNGEFMHIRFATAASTSGSTLPVTLTSFNGVAKQKDVQLNWTTSTETNNLGFEVERSVDGRTFEKTGNFVKGAGNSRVVQNYSLLDAGALVKANVLYYRLKQIDRDGKVTYSQVIRVAASAEQVNALTVYPNPFNTFYNVAFNATSEGKAMIEMTDLQGRLVTSQTASVVSGTNTILMDNIGTLQVGIYFVKVTKDGETTIVKLVKN